MMAKITKGSSFGGAVKYVMDERKSANMIDSNGVQMRDLEAIIHSFNIQAELDTRLHREGIATGFKTKGSTSQIEGVRFTADNITFNGSKIDRQFSFSKIDYALKQNLRAEQKEVEPEYVQKWQPAPEEPQEQEQSEGLIECLLGLLDPSNGSEEVAAAAAPEKKKKRKDEHFKMRF